ncbi:MAG: hypothetical protein MJA31_04950 [Clostridia bacterium]|nr:hypothetical protein [Clostridia bacterium]
MNQDNRIIEDMKKLGLSEYEIKAYLSLLQIYPVNGYALSKNSSIPRSRIYEILDSLKKKQIVFEETVEGTTLYHPINPKVLINKYKDDFQNVLSHVDEYTNQLYQVKENDNKLIVLKGRNKIIDFANTLISKANKRIALSIWHEEIQDLSEALDKALSRGVILRGVYFGHTNPYEDLVPHRRIERYLSEKNERYFTMTIDGEDVMSGIVSRGADSQVTWTKDIGFIELSEDYIAHDLMINQYSKQLTSNQKKEFEDFSDRIRKDYFGFTEEEFKTFK